MNALAMPISSRTADETPCACFCTKSPRILEERSATCWHTLDSSCASFLSACCISHDAIISQGAPRSAGIVQVMQMGYRFAHCKKSLMEVKRPAKQHVEKLARALGFFPDGIGQFAQPVPMMPFQLFHAPMRAAEWLAMRGKHEHVVRKLAVARDRIEEKAQRIALGVDRPHAHIGGDGRQEHVACNDRIELLRKQREMLGRVSMPDDRLP